MKNITKIITDLWKIFAILLLLSNYPIPVHGIVTRAPENKTAFIGQDVNFTCGSTIEDAVDWFVKPIGSNNYRQLVFNFQGLIPFWLPNGKYSFTKVSKDEQIFTIHNVTHDDAGTYRCVDEYALFCTEVEHPERFRQAELVVIVDTVVLIDSHVNFTCFHPIDHNVRWDYVPARLIEDRNITYDIPGATPPSLRYKYSFTKVSKKKETLTIHNVTNDDAGTYRCIAEDKHGDAHIYLEAKLKAKSD